MVEYLIIKLPKEFVKDVIDKFIEENPSSGMVTRVDVIRTSVRSWINWYKEEYKDVHEKQTL